MEAAANHPAIPASFAGALAAFAADAENAGEQSAVPSGDGLADDVAIFSYEHVLRAHRRHPAAEQAAQEAAANVPESAAPESIGASGSDQTEYPSALPHQKHKSASITIRMNQAECAQLKKRAAAANLTVSAYMRSCILEAETLRAQVKEALAELRASAPVEAQGASRHAPRRWWRPWPHAGPRSAQA